MHLSSTGWPGLRETWARLRYLVNNAGIERMGSVEELPLAEFRAVMETNYFGVNPRRCTQALLPGMRQRRAGLHHQRGFGGGPRGFGANGRVHSIQVRAGGPQRMPRPRGKGLQPPGGDRRARHYRHPDGTAYRCRFSPFPAHTPSSVEWQPRSQRHSRRPCPHRWSRTQSGDSAVGDTDQLRHPVGPDAAPFLGWRRAMSDEAWVALGALDDDAWVRPYQADFGMDARPQAQV